MIESSVIIPVYNRTKELSRCLLSVLNQTITNIEVIIVDDFSEENIQQVVHLLNDDRIRYIRLKKKGNANVCRNVGIKEAKGEFIAMLDSDDEWMPDHLERKVNFLNKKKCDGVFGSCVVDNGESKVELLSRNFHPDEKMVNYILSDGYAPTPTHFYKATCAKQILWDESLLRHQDFDYSVRFASQFKFMPSTDVTCIVHWKKGEKRNEHIESQIKFINKHYEEIKPEIYNLYFSSLFLKISDRKDIPLKLRSFIKKESCRFIHSCTLIDYLTVHGKDKNALHRFLMRFLFAFKVVFRI